MIGGILFAAVTWMARATFLVAVKAGGVGEHLNVALFCSAVRVVTAMVFGNARVPLAADEAKRTVFIFRAA